MNGLTRFVLKRPITTLMAVLCLIVFGYTSVTSMSLENIPDMEMPVLMVMTTYSGASPEDVNEIITKPIEDQVGTLSVLNLLHLIPVKAVPWSCWNMNMAQIQTRRMMT